MCYNYNDLAVARSVYRKQTNQLINNSNDLRNDLRNNSRNRSTSNKSNTSIKQIQLDKEYKNLKNMLPSLNTKPKVSKVCLINEAIRYINELQDQVIQKLNVDPLIIQQKIYEEFNQQKIDSQLIENLTNNREINSRSNKNNRRLPLEELNNMKSIKRQKI